MTVFLSRQRCQFLRVICLIHVLMWMILGFVFFVVKSSRYVVNRLSNANRIGPLSVT